jgi:hypothetical protein
MIPTKSIGKTRIACPQTALPQFDSVPLESEEETMELATDTHSAVFLTNVPRDEKYKGQASAQARPLPPGSQKRPTSVHAELLDDHFGRLELIERDEAELLAEEREVLERSVEVFEDVDLREVVAVLAKAVSGDAEEPA